MKDDVPTAQSDASTSTNRLGFSFRVKKEEGEQGGRLVGPDPNARHLISAPHKALDGFQSYRIRTAPCVPRCIDRKRAVGSLAGVRDRMSSVQLIALNGQDEL